MNQAWRTTKPASSEYAPYYAGYINGVPEGDLLETLEHQLRGSLALWRGAPAAKADFRYAEGKWTMKELINHVIDAERIFTYRALRAARGDETPLPGFDENNYASAARTTERTVADLSDEFEHVRRASLALFRSLDDAEAGRVVVASTKPITARALMYIVAGHERHHDMVLQKRYLTA